jgi:hypothetical protein
MLFLRFVRSFGFRTIELVTLLCGLDEAKRLFKATIIHLCRRLSDRKAVYILMLIPDSLFILPKGSTRA